MSTLRVRACTHPYRTTPLAFLKNTTYIRRMASKKPQPPAQAKIKTSGKSKTKPDMGAKPLGERVPVAIYGRHWRDPKSLDLTDIERAKDDAEAKLRNMEKQLDDRKAAIEKQKHDAEIEKQVQLKLALNNNFNEKGDPAV